MMHTSATVYATVLVWVFVRVSLRVSCQGFGSPLSPLPLQRTPELRRDAHELLLALSTHYNYRCAVVTIDVKWSNSPYISIKDDEVGRGILNRLKETVTGISTKKCIVLVLTAPPSNDLLQSLVPKGTTSIFFFVVLPTKKDVNDVLLDGRLSEREDVIAVISKRGTYYVYNRLLYTAQGVPQTHLVLKWKSGESINITKPLYPEQMKNFYGTKFQATTLDFRPFTDYVKTENSLIVAPKDCLDIYILNQIARKLNFTYEIKMPSDGLWGTLFANGTWTGVVGDVQYRRTNLSLVLSLTMERLEIADFTRMYFIDPLTFVSAKSRPLPQWKKIFEPFNGLVWAASWLSIFGGAVMYHLLRNGKIKGRPVSFAQTCLDIFGSFFAQGVSNIPVRLATQIFLGFWFLYALVVTTFYKTALMAALAIPTIPPTLNTLEELYNSDLQYGMIDAKGSEYQLFSTSEVEIYQKLFKRMTFFTSHESMEKVVDGAYSYIYFKSNIQSIVSTQYTDNSGKTNLHIASEEFFPGGYAWAFPKGVPYRRTFDEVMWRCVQAGLITKWVGELNKIYWKEIQDAKTPEEIAEEERINNLKRSDGLIVLNVIHLQGAFFLLVIGLAGSLVAFFFEMITKLTTKKDKLSDAESYDKWKSDT